MLIHCVILARWAAQGTGDGRVEPTVVSVVPRPKKKRTLLCYPNISPPIALIFGYLKIPNFWSKMSPPMSQTSLISQPRLLPMARDHPYYIPHPPGYVISYLLSVRPQWLPRNKGRAPAVVLDSTKNYQ